MKHRINFLLSIMLAAVLLLPLGLTPAFTTQAQAASKCRVEGLKKGTNASLRRNLCKMSRALGPIEVTSSCRTRKANRGASKSYHLYNRGCKAADIVVRGIGKKRVLAWWAKNVGGGRGYYCGRRFVHVDVGPNRTWFWYCRK